MPAQDDGQTSWLEATDSSGSLPVPGDVTEAVRLIGDAAAFLSAGRPAGEPHHGEDDWPQDLDAPETRDMLGYLAEIVHAASSCLSRISYRQRVPGAAQPELDTIANLLADAGRKLTVLGGRLEQEAQATAPAQYAGLDFPHAPAAGPVGGPGQQPPPGTAATPPQGIRNHDHSTRPASPHYQVAGSGAGGLPRQIPAPVRAQAAPRRRARTPGGSRNRPGHPRQPEGNEQCLLIS